MDEQLAFITGYADTTVEVVCQRCLGAMKLPLAVDFRLGLVASEAQAESLPANYEPLIAQQPLSVAELVEDELLLALPLAPKHDDAALCQSVVEIAPAAPEPAEPEANPFAQLASLLESNKRSGQNH